MVVPSAAADDYLAYSYNGYVLPPMPVVDRVTYPYAAILVSSWASSPYYYLVFSSTKFYFYEDWYKTIDGEKVPVLTYHMYIHDDGSGFNWFTMGPGNDVSVPGDLVWSDYDVLTDTGSLCLAASEPVPLGAFPGGDSGSSGDGSGGTDNSGSSGDSGTTGGSCGCPNYSSILSSILSHLTEQSDWLAVFGQAWITSTTRILELLEGLTPVVDPNETELKEATSEAMESVNDSLFADDAPTKVTASDVKDVAQIGEAASSMFDSGVSVGSFFDAFNNINLVSLFTERAKNDLYAVNDVSTYRVDSGDYVVDYYSENLNKIMEFVGKGD